jgi:hypothetical protein
VISIGIVIILIIINNIITGTHRNANNGSSLSLVHRSHHNCNAFLLRTMSMSANALSEGVSNCKGGIVQVEDVRREICYKAREMASEC